MHARPNLRFSLGDHFSLIYKTRQQLLAVLAQFFSEGLSENQKCIYVTDLFDKKEILIEFEKYGVDLRERIRSGQFGLMCSKEVYIKKGYFSPADMISLLRLTEKKSLDEGYSGLRIAGEAMWLRKDIPGTELFMDYESRLETFFPSSRTCALCIYEESSMGHDLLAECIHCHPGVLFYGRACDNYYYSPGLYMMQDRPPLPACTYSLMKSDFTR